MVIIGDKYGQLANRLFIFAHFIANAIEHDYTLINPSFDEYCQYFRSTKHNTFNPYPISVNLPVKIHFPWFHRTVQVLQRRFPESPLHSAMHLHRGEYYDLNKEDFVVNSKRKIIIANGWLYRDYNNFRKHASTIRKLFEPLDTYQREVERSASQYKNGSNVLVGVHVRRGDYKSFMDGKYYYNDHTYANFIQQTEHMFHRMGKEVSFAICSGDRMDSTLFSNKNIHISERHFIVDLYLLSKCDYLIGPPSTFTMWASFYGETPLLQLKSTDQTVQFEDFAIIDG